jgi:hypothetical protein
MGPGLTKEKRKIVLEIVEDLCRSYHGNDEGKFYKLDSLTEDDKKELGEVSGLDYSKKD